MIMKNFLKLLSPVIPLIALLAFGAPVHAANLGDIKVVDTLAALKLVQPNLNTPVAFVLGWTTVGDGGGGLYKVTTSSAATNYGCVTSTLNTSRQWIRQPGLPGFSAPPRTQTLTTASNILAEAHTVRVAGSGGAVILTSTPTIRTNDVVDGQLLFIEGTHDSNTIGIPDDGTVAGTKVQLNAVTNRTLGAGDILLLKYNSTLGTWQEVSFSNN